MEKTDKTLKKLPHGYCKRIADIVGSDKFYVSRVLAEPENFNGPKANFIKQAARLINLSNNAIKESIQEQQNQSE